MPWGPVPRVGVYVCVWGGAGSVFICSTDARRRERAKEMGTIFVPLYRIKLSLPLVNEEF